MAAGDKLRSNDLCVSGHEGLSRSQCRARLDSSMRMWLSRRKIESESCCTVRVDHRTADVGERLVTGGEVQLSSTGFLSASRP